MNEVISGNMVGSYSQLGKTLLLVDADGNQIPGVIVDQEVIFTATDNDVREGLVYASDGGVSTGTKDIPSYYTSYGCRMIPANTEVCISVPECDYSNLLIIITAYSTSIKESVSSTYVSMNDGMYAVNSAAKLSDIIIDVENEEINLGLIVPEKSVIRYLVTREEF